MKRNFLLVLTIFLVSCAPTPQPLEVSSTPTAKTVVPITHTSLISQTITPVPTQTLRPISAIPNTPHPLALNEFNAGTEMKRLNVIGTGKPHDIKFSPDGSLLAIATGRGVYIYDGETFEDTRFIEVNDSVTAIAFNPNGETIALAVDGKTSIWNTNSGQKLIDLNDEMIYVHEIAYSAEEYVAALGGTCRGCGSAVEAMILWDTITGEKIYEERDIYYESGAIEFTFDGKTLFFGGKGGLTSLAIESGETTEYSKSSLRVESAIDVPLDFILDESSNKIYAISPYYGESGKTLSLSDNRQQVFSVCTENHISLIKSDEIGACISREEIILFNLDSGIKIGDILTHQKPSVSKYLTAMSPNGDALVYSSNEGFEIIELPSKKPIASIQMSDFDHSQSGIIEINGQTLYVVAVLSAPGKIELFNIHTGELIRTLQLECCEITGFTFAPDHKSAATPQESVLSIWDLESQRIVYELDTKESLTSAITFSPDGTKIFIIHYEDFLLEIAFQTGEIKRLKWNPYPYGSARPLAVDNFQFNKNGEIIVLDYYDKGNNEFSPILTGILPNNDIEIPYSFTSDFDLLETFAIDSKNQYLATGTKNGISIWEMPSVSLLSKLDKHEQRSGDGWIGAIAHLIFSPNSNLLASVGFDGTTRLWNVQTGTELRRLNVCCSVSFTPDGRYLVTAGDGVIRVWGIP